MWWQDALFSFLMQVLCTIVVIIAFGFIIAAVNRRFYANFGDNAIKVCYFTGFIGTPIHELAHALFCIIFGHKITDMKLFQISSDDGTLGYVSHRYNPKNLYHQIGNFFIGIAPITVIAGLLVLFSHLLLPDFADAVVSMAGEVQIGEWDKFFAGFWNVIVLFFSFIGTWQWWVFMLIGFFLALHMTMSPADLKGAMGGLGFLLLALAIADVIMVFVGGLSEFTAFMTTAGSYLLCFLSVSLMIALIMLIVSFVIRLIFHRR